MCNFVPETWIFHQSRLEKNIKEEFTFEHGVERNFTSGDVFKMTNKYFKRLAQIEMINVYAKLKKIKSMKVQNRLIN